jgi:hypothetical protein
MLEKGDYLLSKHLHLNGSSRRLNAKTLLSELSSAREAKKGFRNDCLLSPVGKLIPNMGKLQCRS